MQLLHSLHVAQQAGEALFTQKLNGHGDDITLRQAVVLDAVRANPGGSQTAIVNATGIDRSTLADMVKRMTRKGWLTRRRTKDDARAYSVVITPDGTAMLKAAQTAAKKAEAELIQSMPQVEGLRVSAA